MTDHDDIQLDEETLRQIEEEARREAEAQLATDEDFKKQIEAEAKRAVGLADSSTPDVAQEPPPVEDVPPQDYDEYEGDEGYDEGEEDAYDAEPTPVRKAAVRSVSSSEEDEPTSAPSHIDLLEQEIAKKSNTLKIALIAIISVIILGGVGVFLIIKRNQDRKNDDGSGKSVKAGGSKKVGAPSEKKKKNTQARVLLSRVRLATSRTKIIPGQVYDGLDDLKELKEKFPEFVKENQSAVDAAEEELLKRKKKVDESMMNMGN